MFDEVLYFGSNPIIGSTRRLCRNGYVGSDNGICQGKWIPSKPPALVGSDTGMTAGQFVSTDEEGFAANEENIGAQFLPTRGC